MNDLRNEAAQVMQGKPAFSKKVVLELEGLATLLGRSTQKGALLAVAVTSNSRLSYLLGKILGIRPNPTNGPYC